MIDPPRFKDDPEAPRLLSELIEGAKGVRPTSAQKLALATKLGVGGSVLALPFAKWLLFGGLLAGGGVAAVMVARTPAEPPALVEPAAESNPARDSSHPTAPSSQDVASNDGAQADLDGPPNRGAPSGGPADRLEADAQRQERSSALVPPSPSSPDDARSGSTAARSGEPSSSLGTKSKDSLRTSGNKSAPEPERSTSPARTGSGTPSEAEILSAARGLLTQDPKRALQLLAQHQALYPNGVLEQEREVLRVRALKEAGQVDTAAREAERFRKHHPDSAHSTGL